LQLRAPVPCTSEPSIDATTRIVKIVSAASIECRLEEIVQNIFFQLLNASKTILYKLQDSIIFFAYALQVF
jgi:hypothetical protein